MSTPKKEQTVGSLTDLVSNSKTVIFTEPQGLTMKDFNSIRSKFRPAGIEFHVVKNTLIRRASEGTALSDLAKTLEGPTAAVFGLQDSIAPARLLSEFMKESKANLTIKGGVVDGQAYNSDQIMQIAKLPSREVLLSQLVGGLQSPITSLAGTLQMMLSGLVWTLQGIADQKV